MALKQNYKTPASEIGGALGPNGIIDAEALSDAAGIKRVVVACAAFTINSTVKAYGGPLGFRGKFIGGYFVAETLPIGGTLRIDAAIYDASATAEVVLATCNPEVAGSTASIGTALTIDATINDPLIVEPTDSIRSLSVADNNAVGTAMVAGYLVLLFVPIEPTAGALCTDR